MTAASEAAKAGGRLLARVADLDVAPDGAIRRSGVEMLPKRIAFAHGAHTLATRLPRPTRDPESLAWGAIWHVIGHVPGLAGDRACAGSGR